MKRLLIPLIFIVTVIGCSKNESGDLKYFDTIEGGCAVNKGLSGKGDPLYRTDTLTYSLTNDSLNIFVGFNAACCSEISSSSTVKGDSILIKILTIQPGLCNCICYYTYNFKYSGNGNFYKYRVSGSNLRFSGQIKP